MSLRSSGPVQVIRKRYAPGCFAALVVLVTARNVEAQANPNEGPRPTSVRSIAFSPDGASLAVARGVTEGAGDLSVWDVASLKPRFIRDEPAGITSVAYFPDGATLAVGRWATTGLLVDPRTGETKRELGGHGESFVRNVAVGPGGRLLATGGYDRAIRIWDTANWELQRELIGHAASLRVLAFSPDGKWLASAGGEERKARLWNLENPDRAPRVFEFASLAAQVTFSPDGRRLAIAHWGGDTLLVDVNLEEDSGQPFRTNSANCAAFSPDGKWLAVASNVTQVLVFPLAEQPKPDVMREVVALIEALDADDYDKRQEATRKLSDIGGPALPAVRAALESKSAEVRIRAKQIIEKASGLATAIKLVGPSEDREWESVAFSPDGKLIAAGSWQGTVQLWNFADRKLVGKLALPDKPR